MFLLINCNHDGDTYNLFNKIEDSKEEFEVSCADERNHRVVLVKLDSLGQEFGFGSRGEIFGAEVIFEYDNEEGVL